MSDKLYRGINRNTKTFVYGDLIHKWGKVYIGYWVKDDDSPAGDGYIECEVIPSTVGEFTGFEDINKKAIFEKDKIRVKWTKSSEYFITDTVVFNNGSFMLRDHQSILCNWEYKEVINDKCA